jgi:hypothetical protein
MQDRIDGGISLLLRSPGYDRSKVDGLDNIIVEVYLPPREIEEGGSELCSVVTSMIYAFGKDIVLPHLQRFEGRCRAEGVEPPKPPGT